MRPVRKSAGRARLGVAAFALAGRLAAAPPPELPVEPFFKKANGIIGPAKVINQPASAPR